MRRMIELEWHLDCVWEIESRLVWMEFLYVAEGHMFREAGRGSG